MLSLLYFWLHFGPGHSFAACTQDDHGPVSVTRDRARRHSTWHSVSTRHALSQARPRTLDLQTTAASRATAAQSIAPCTGNLPAPSSLRCN